MAQQRLLETGHPQKAPVSSWAVTDGARGLPGAVGAAQAFRRAARVVIAQNRARRRRDIGAPLSEEHHIYCSC